VNGPESAGCGLPISDFVPTSKENRTHMVASAFVDGSISASADSPFGATYLKYGGPHATRPTPGLHQRGGESIGVSKRVEDRRKGADA
jgi:hypothetical protein